MTGSFQRRRNSLREERCAAAGLGTILDKVLADEALDKGDGLVLYRTRDLNALGYLANLVRESKHGDRAHFVRDHHLNPTNVCRHACAFCAFARRKGQAGAYEMDLEEIGRRADRIRELGVREVHLVGGVHPDWSYEHYLDMVRTLCQRLPGVSLKGWTAVEVDEMARISGHDLGRVLLDLAEAGLDHLAGGGAEIFAPEVRRRICASKADGARWLEIHETAHSLGLPSNATMLYGHLEEPAHKVDHLLALRDLQARSLRAGGAGFTAFIPLAFHPANTALSHLPGSTARDHLRELAVSRLLLDNVPHLKAYWIMMTVSTAQLGLDFGADDLGGTVVEERITHDAGAETEQGLSADQMVALIRQAGRIPIERMPGHRPVAAPRCAAPGRAVAAR